MRDQAVLLSVHDVKHRLADGEIPVWATDIFHSFQEDLLSESRPFPCVFGVEGFRKDKLRFVFLEDPRSEETLQALRDALVAYTETYQSIDRLTSFVAFFKPDETLSSLPEYHQQFWDILQYLHDHDPQPWPETIPADVTDPYWEFSFNGEPIFVVCNTPAHVERRSRKSSTFLITFQPRWVFEGLEGHTPKGQKARTVVRERLVKYDVVPPHPSLGSYGDEQNHEWKQYFLHDSNDTTLEKCPFNH